MHSLFHSLISSSIQEDSWAIVLTLTSLNEINNRLRSLITSNSLKNLTNRDSIFEDAEIESKLTIMKFCVLHMEQTNKILLLIYLFRTSVNQRDQEDFSIIIEHLYYKIVIL